MATATMGASAHEIHAKVMDGGRITPEEAMELYHAPLTELAELANTRRNQLKAKAYDGRGNEIVTYIIDRNINYTNVCNVFCTFCAFMRTEKDADHYVLSQETIGQKIRELEAIGGTQILMQGGHHPKLTIDYYLDLLQYIRANHPAINIHAFSPPEFNHFARVFGMTLEEVIVRFKEAGLGSIPGGGGEILVDRVRNIISRLKCNSDQWLEVMRIAHRNGLNSSATMMFGHVETVEERIESLRRLRELQDETGGFTAFHLLDVSAGEHAAQGDAGRLARVSAHAGAEPRLSGQFRERAIVVGDAGPEDRPGGAAVWGQRLRLGDDGGERGLCCGHELPPDGGRDPPVDHGARLSGPAARQLVPAAGLTGKGGSSCWDSPSPVS